MRKSVISVSASVALAAGLAGVSATALAQDGFTFKGREQGHCKLTNVAYGRELYNGSCVIKQEISGKTNIYTIKMGGSSSFKFATADGRTWMHGPEPVRFRDRGHTGIFRWGDFRLEVDDD